MATDTPPITINSDLQMMNQDCVR